MLQLKIVYYGLLVLCLVTLFFNIKKLDRIYHFFIPIIILAISVQVFGDAMKRYHIEGFNFIYHIYIPVEYSLLALFYHFLIRNPVVKKIIWISVPLLLTFSLVYYSIYKKAFYEADFADFCISAFFVCIWVTVFFIELIRSEEDLQLTTYPAFWINAANLLFYGGCLVIMGVYFYLSKTDGKLAAQLFKINHYLNLILYCMYTIAFICRVNWKKS